MKEKRDALGGLYNVNERVWNCGNPSLEAICYYGFGIWMFLSNKHQMAEQLMCNFLMYLCISS